MLLVKVASSTQNTELLGERLSTLAKRAANLCFAILVGKSDISAKPSSGGIGFVCSDCWGLSVIDFYSPDGIPEEACHQAVRVVGVKIVNPGSHIFSYRQIYRYL